MLVTVLRYFSEYFLLVTSYNFMLYFYFYFRYFFKLLFYFVTSCFYQKVKKGFAACERLFSAAGRVLCQTALE